MRRTSNNADGVSHSTPLSVRGNIGDMREHLKHLGPSNLASRPKNTRYQTVKIKPGNMLSASDAVGENRASEPVLIEEPYTDEPAALEAEGAGLVSAGKGASDGVEALRQGYGTMDNHSPILRSPDKQLISFDDQLPAEDSVPQAGVERCNSDDTLGEMRSRDSSPARKQRIGARSGSITENVVDVGGVRKVILETTSSSDDAGRSSLVVQNTSSTGSSASGAKEQGEGSKGEGAKKGNKRRRNRKKKSANW